MAGMAKRSAKKKLLFGEEVVGKRHDVPDPPAGKPEHYRAPRVGIGFQKGCKGGPGRGHKKPRPEFGAELEADLRRAYTQAAAADDSPGVKRARRMLEEDYGKFMAIYAKVCGDRVREDEGGELGNQESAVVELVDELLDEWESDLKLFHEWRATREFGTTVGADAVGEGEGEEGTAAEGGEREARRDAGDRGEAGGGDEGGNGCQRGSDGSGEAAGPAGGVPGVSGE